MTWPVERIPDRDSVYIRAHRAFFDKDSRLRPGVFRDQGDGMSCDWSKYSTIEEAQQRAKVPRDNGVVELVVGSMREEVPTLSVEHRPIPENRAHSEVVGTKTPEVRLKLLRIADLRLRPE